MRLSITAQVPCLCFLCWLLLATPKEVNADSAAILFEAKPDHCVALHQGQSCYQNIRFSWSGLASENYCLLDKGAKKSINCWFGQGSGGYTHAFVSEQSTVFQLVNADSIVVAETAFTVAWVYKSKRSSRSAWRLF